MQKSQNKAFTLVELIVVITILAILGTIAFISLQGYSAQARDSRRVSDISNIKTSLELFSLNTGKYPIPDEYSIMSYSGETLFMQGKIGDNVTQNLSANLQEKPLDPLHEIEYIYSTTDSRKEYEVLAFYEGEISSSSLIKRGVGEKNITHAANQYKIKVSGNFNGIYATTKNYIIPTPSILSSDNLPIDLQITPTSIGSMIITGGTNFPNTSIAGTEQKTTGLNINLAYADKIDKNSDNNQKLNVINAIQNTYSGSSLANINTYADILAKNTEQEKLAYVDDIVLNNGKTGTSTITSSCDTKPSYSNTTFNEGEPTQTNQTRQNTDSSSACYYECNSGYTGDDCSTIVLYSSCKEILNNGQSIGDGTYTIDPENNGTGFQIYCDMTIDGGGWTLARKSQYNIGVTGITTGENQSSLANLTTANASFSDIIYNIINPTEVWNICNGYQTIYSRNMSNAWYSNHGTINACSYDVNLWNSMKKDFGASTFTSLVYEACGGASESSYGWGILSGIHAPSSVYYGCYDANRSVNTTSVAPTKYNNGTGNPIGWGGNGYVLIR